MPEGNMEDLLAAQMRSIQLILRFEENLKAGKKND